MAAADDLAVGQWVGVAAVATGGYYLVGCFRVAVVVVAGCYCVGSYLAVAAVVAAAAGRVVLAK